MVHHETRHFRQNDNLVRSHKLPCRPYVSGYAGQCRVPAPHQLISHQFSVLVGSGACMAYFCVSSRQAGCLRDHPCAT
jgi:hypothetical protein